MQDYFEDMWKFSGEHALKGRTWNWWWWLFFFDNPDSPEHPRQLMFMWGNRNCRKVRVNDFRWGEAFCPVVTGNSAKLDCIVASWYYDGEKMHDPLIIDSGPTETKWGGDTGSIIMENERGWHACSGRHADLKLKSETGDVSLDLRMTRWTDPMADLVPTGRNFIGNMGYSMLKYRGLLASGKIRVGNSETAVSGRCYFQKVRINTVTPCWYWATAQWDSGAYMQYFLPHLGLPVFRQNISHSRGPDWGKKMLSRTLNFYDPFEKKEHLMKDVRVDYRYENDLPVFTVRARSPDAELTAEMAAYSRCCWDIAQPLVPPVWLGIFYNEYPARLTKFSFESGDRKLGMEEMGKSYCNCEHTWGAL